MKPQRWGMVAGWCRHGVSEDATCSRCAESNMVWNCAIEDVAQKMESLPNHKYGKLARKELADRVRKMKVT